MPQVHDTLSSARQFIRDHAVQLRGDASNLQQLRQSNLEKFQRLKQQNVMITNLKKSLLEARRKILTSTSTTTPNISTGTIQQSSPRTYEATSSPCSSCTSLSSITEGTRLEQLTYFKRNTSFKRSQSFWFGSRKHLHQTTSSSTTSSSTTTTSSSIYSSDDHHYFLKKEESRLQIIDVYLKAIHAVQKHFRKVAMLKMKDELIKLSTIPLITYSHDDTSAAYGLLKYPDRLLHAANLEDAIDRCLSKQQCIIQEASTKMPPSISSNVLSSSNTTTPSSSPIKSK